MGKGSGWSLHRIDGILLRINRFRPLRVASYIQLPKFLQIKKCIINPKNKDNYCFKWAIYLDIYFHVNFHYFNLESKFDFKHIDFPSPLSRISCLEKNNVSINIYSIDEKKSIFPLKAVSYTHLISYDITH